MEERGYLKNKMGGYEPVPDAKSWDAVLAELPSKRRKGVFFWITAAMVILSVTGGSIYLLRLQKETKLPTPQNTLTASENAEKTDKHAASAANNNSPESNPNIESPYTHSAASIPSEAATRQDQTASSSSNMAEKTLQLAETTGTANTINAGSKSTHTQSSQKTAFVPAMSYQSNRQKATEDNIILTNSETGASEGTNSSSPNAMNAETHLLATISPGIENTFEIKNIEKLPIQRDIPRVYKPMPWWKATPVIITAFGGAGYNSATTYINTMNDQFRNTQLSTEVDHLHRISVQLGGRVEKPVTRTLSLYSTLAINTIRGDINLSNTVFQTTDFSSSTTSDGITLLRPVGNEIDEKIRLQIIQTQLELGVSVKELPVIGRLNAGAGLRNAVKQNSFKEEGRDVTTKYLRQFFFNISVEQKLNIGKGYIHIEPFINGSAQPDWYIGSYIQRNYRTYGCKVHVPIN